MPPAKSSVPPLNSQPGPNAQWASTAYTSTDHSAAKTRNAPKRIRSTTAPEIRATVMMQKVAWKAKNSRCGIVDALARRERRRP